MKTLEVLFTPADFTALKRRNLDGTTCVVFDVFRATSSMVAALANGALALVPVEEISEALAIRKKEPAVLLAGERDGVRIRAGLTGGVDFDLGNSPREYTKERVSGKKIVTTTTNGTRALRACAHARKVLIGTFLNLQATMDLLSRENPDDVLLICAGTFEQTALEDVLGAGALVELIFERVRAGGISDSAKMARQIYQQAGGKLLEAASQSRNGQRLLSNPELRDDVMFCLQRDIFKFVAEMNDNGSVAAGNQVDCL